jgi:hypothetical protein
MRSLAPDTPEDTPEQIIQPCSEACACFKRLAGSDGWSDYGVCTNPQSPNKGCPVRIGHECPYYLPAGEE